MGPLWLVSCPVGLTAGAGMGEFHLGEGRVGRGWPQFLSLHSGVCRCLSEPLHLCKLAPMLGGHGFPCLCPAPSTPGHPSLAWS